MLLALLLPLALAQEGEPPPPPPAPPPAPPAEEAAAEEDIQPDDEMIVFGELEVARRRAALEADLKALGYTPTKKKDGRTTYRPETPWYPSVIIDDDGYALIRRSPVRFRPWIKGESKLTWISCIPPFIVMCVDVSGQLVTRRRLQHQKTRVTEAIDPRMDDWREAIVSNAMNHRINEDIPEMLDELWERGRLPGEEAPVPDRASRRAAILDFWSSRACTPEGAAAREQTSNFLNYVVQTSDAPVTEDERARAEAANLCGERLELRPPIDAAAAQQ